MSFSDLDCSESIANAFFDSISVLNRDTKLALIDDSACSGKILDVLAFDEDFEVVLAALSHKNVSTETIETFFRVEHANYRMTGKLSRKAWRAMFDFGSTTRKLPLSVCQFLLQHGDSAVHEHLATFLLPSIDSYHSFEMWENLSNSDDIEVRIAVAKSTERSEVLLALSLDSEQSVRDQAVLKAKDLGIVLKVSQSK